MTAGRKALARRMMASLRAAHCVDDTAAGRKIHFLTGPDNGRQQRESPAADKRPRSQGKKRDRQGQVSALSLHWFSASQPSAERSARFPSDDAARGTPDRAVPVVPH